MTDDKAKQWKFMTRTIKITTTYKPEREKKNYETMNVWNNKYTNGSEYNLIRNN